MLRFVLASHDYFIVTDREIQYRVNRCLVCGRGGIDTTIEGRFVTTTCDACRATLKIEFDPPDEPNVRARIERISTSHNDLGTRP